MLSRSKYGVRPLIVFSGCVCTASSDVLSRVRSWSMNWPMKVTPAPCVGLFGLLALSDGSVMRATGPAARLSFASRSPPFSPSAINACSIFLLCDANDGKVGNMRPKRFTGMAFAACTGLMTPPAIAAVATAPALTDCMKLRRLTWFEEKGDFFPFMPRVLSVYGGSQQRGVRGFSCGHTTAGHAEAGAN